LENLEIKWSDFMIVDNVVEIKLLSLVCKCCKGDWVATPFLLQNKDVKVYIEKNDLEVL